MSENEKRLIQQWVSSQLENREADQLIEEAIRDDLLRDASQKPIRAFMQFDYFNYSTGVTSHDGDFDMFGGAALELRRGDCLRVQIPEDFSKEEALEALARIREWIESGDGGGNDAWDISKHSAMTARTDALARLLSAAKNALEDRAVGPTPADPDEIPF